MDSIYIYQFLVAISSGLMYFLTAAGMSITVTGMNVINFGQGQFYMLGTLLAFYLMFLGMYDLLTPMALVAFLLLWTLPVLLMADWTGRY